MASTSFRNIALIGVSLLPPHIPHPGPHPLTPSQATGNLGSHILTALTTVGFTVTEIQRPTSTARPPSTVKSLKIDLTSQPQLTSAFKNQDIVISAAPNPVLSTEKHWILAAIAAGVKRIVLSEYSTNLETPLSRQLPITQDKLATRRYVEGLASEGKVEWTSINNGPFLIKEVWTGGWIGPNVGSMTTTYHDGGARFVCSTTLERTAEGVAKALAPEHAGETRNKPVYVYSTPMSEKRMTEIVARVKGVEVEAFEVKRASVEEVTKGAYEALERGDRSKMFGFYIPFCFGEGYGGDFREQAWNEKSGLREMGEGEVEEMVRAWL